MFQGRHPADNERCWRGETIKRTAARFGLSDDEWETALQEMRDAIMTAARERRMTFYSEVAAAVTVVEVQPFSPLMNHLLGAIFDEEHRGGRPLLTSIVTHKNDDMEPGSGFYDMARSLGYRFDAPYVFWAEQVQDVFTRYGGGG